MASAKRELQVSVRVQGRQNAEVLGQRCTLLSSPPPSPTLMMRLSTLLQKNKWSRKPAVIASVLWLVTQLKSMGKIAVKDL